jgi:hypothetical protein
MTRYFLIAALLTVSAFGLGACEGAKKELGLTKTTPDEFAVVKRAPLEMPPEFSLRPPQPGAPRPQETATSEQARTAVLGNPAVQTEGLTQGEAALLGNANAGANPDIRQIVDVEAANSKRKNEPVVKKLLNIGKDQQPAAVIVDPQAEAERLKNNAAEGKSVTDGETPTIDD